MADAYIGINNAPRKITEMYIGINNQPRRVLKAYIGINNQPRLWYSFYPPAPLDNSSIYYMSGTGTFTTFGSRWYAKVNSGEAYVFSTWAPSNWTIGFVISQYKNAAETNCSYNPGYHTVADNAYSFVMHDHLWYWTTAPYAWAGLHTCDPQTNFIDFRSNPNIPRTHSSEAYMALCKEFLRLYIYS